MLESIPTKAVLRVAEKERQMLEDDLDCRRISLTEDGVSVLHFCHFLGAVVLGTDAVPATLPVEHVMFYRKTVERLIEAGELSASAKERFEAAFCPSQSSSS